ncbi:MAG: PaaI family thioesterase [Pseudomonadota bacterium]
MKFDPDRNWREVKDGGFNEHLGPLLYAKIDDAIAQLAVLLDQRHINFGGVCHGGVYMAASDVAMGITAHRIMDRRPCATIDFRGHFLAAAKRDQWLVVEARMNRATVDLVFMECEAWAGERKCFVASGIWKLLRTEPGREPDMPPFVVESQQS